MFKNIIFDWSGVIKDAARHQLWAVNHIFESLNLPQITLEEMRDKWVQPYMKFYNQYKPDLPLAEEQALYRQTISREDAPATDAYPGMTDLVKRLKISGAKLFVLSSDPENVLLPEVERYGLSGVFNHVYAHIYDKAERIHELIVNHECDPKVTAFIGDSNHEIEVGKMAGIKTIAVTWGFSSEKKLKSFNPDYIAHNVKELEDILLK